MLVIYPIAETQVDWQKFLALAKQSTNRSVTSGLDKKNIQAKGMTAFVAALGELQQEGSDALATIRNAGALLRHVSCTFLVVGSYSVIHDLAIQGRLSLIEADTINDSAVLAICSNNMEQWRDAIISSCSVTAHVNVRMFYNRILQAFDIMGYSKFFDGYGRKSQSDGTFLLVSK